jgi:protein O-mannosyl-transferase
VNSEKIELSVAIEKNGLRAGAFASVKKRRVLAGLILVILTLAFYNPVAHNGFVFFDDSPYILKNPHVQSGLTWANVKWAFSTFYSANWHPLTWLSHALDFQLFGLNPAGHHYVSLLFHTANALLVFIILEPATELWLPSFFVAALFALHPLNVESVAWAAERKNVLSMFFGLLALLAYTKYVRSEKKSVYLAAVIMFALGLVAKPQIIPLPFLLLLWDYWPLKRMFGDEDARLKSSARQEEPTSAAEAARISKSSTAQRKSCPSRWTLVLEKIPFFILAVGSGVVTLMAQRAGSAVRTVAEVPVRARVENSIVSYVRYLGQVFWPVKLAPLYPHPGNSLPMWKVGICAAILLLITTIAIHRRERPYLLVGWLWFLGALIPTIGLIQVGEQAMADRYMYLPLVGILIGLVWRVRDFAVDRKISKGLLVIPVAALMALGIATYHQLGHWRDGETLWRYTLSVTPANYMAHDNLAMVLAEEGKTDEAITEFREAEALHQYPAPQILTLGAYEQRSGHVAGAIEQYNKALQSSDDPAVKVAALDQIASAYVQEKDWDRAKVAYENALAISPKDVSALVGTALLAERAGDVGWAVSQLEHATKASPSDVGFLLLSGALRRAGRNSEADTTYAGAQKLSVDFNEAQRVANQIASSFGLPSY